MTIDNVTGEISMTAEEIRRMNLWLYDNPRYQSLSWREAAEKFMTEVLNDDSKETTNHRRATKGLAQPSV
ncbi:hypothetical protein [Paenibacillus dendritiformis]|uniref:hypothetical protein n=1 Tax=Paenibacillus dendritiformis TaxID=130049 RepID=UPI00387E0EE3